MTGSSTADVTASYAIAEEITRAEARNFFYSFRFLPPERRRSIYAIYAYSRRLDDAVDSVEEKAVDPDEARAQLDHLAGLLTSDPPDDPLLPALRDTIERYEIRTTYLEELIEGMRMDLEVRRYATFEDLYRYCYRAASAVGLVCIDIFGHRDHEQALLPAEHLGIAMQLTNIVRDVAEDLARDRVYLPQEDLRRFGYGEDDLRRGLVDDRFRSLMAFEVERARDYFRRARPLLPLVLPESRYCPVLLERFYSRILDRIERSGYDVLSRRPRLPRWQKLWLAARTWWEARSSR